MQSGMSIHRRPHPIAKTNCTNTNQRNDNCANDDNTAISFDIGAWAHRNHETIESLTAIAGVCVAIALLVITGFLWGATRKLAISTAELRDAAHDQAEEMRKTRAVAEKNLDLAERQLLITGLQTDIAEKQHKIRALREQTGWMPGGDFRCLARRIDDVWR